MIMGDDELERLVQAHNALRRMRGSLYEIERGHAAYHRTIDILYGVLGFSLAIGVTCAGIASLLVAYGDF
jgi:hypothetical protein